MSASYTLHVAPYGLPGDPEALDHANLVRDGFSWGAFIAPPVWFLVHRHWLVALLVTLVLAGFWFGLRALGVPAGVSFLLNALLWLLVGLEASTLRRLDYARQDRPVVDVVFAANEAEAEAKTFARWLASAEASSAAVPAERAGLRSAVPFLSRPEGPQVIGMFPDLERRT